MIVVDASAAVAGLTTAGAARRMLSVEDLHVPHLVDAEVAHALRRQAATGRVDGGTAGAQLATWLRLGLIRHPMSDHLGRVWGLRENVTAYDGCYVALAESLGCTLVTLDGRLSRASGHRCPITVLPD